MSIILSLISFCTCVGLTYQACSYQFQQQVLSKHNEYRAKHSVQPLQLCPILSDWAQQWADYLAFSDSFEHRQRNRFGENLYYQNGETKPTGSIPVELWYNEIGNYSYFGSEPDMSTSPRWGNFTQLIWKGSKKLGVGCAEVDNLFYVVANYHPIGNVIGLFAENVQGAN